MTGWGGPLISNSSSMWSELSHNPVAGLRHVPASCYAATPASSKRPRGKSIYRRGFSRLNQVFIVLMSVEELYMTSWMPVGQFLTPNIRITKENDMFDALLTKCHQSSFWLIWNVMDLVSSQHYKSFLHHSIAPHPADIGFQIKLNPPRPKKPQMQHSRTSQQL